MLTCKQLVALVTDFLDGKLSFSQTLSFQLHLGFCADCRRFLRQMKGTTAALRALPAEEALPTDVRDELLHRFRDWKSKPST